MTLTIYEYHNINQYIFLRERFCLKSQRWIIESSLPLIIRLLTELLAMDVIVLLCSNEKFSIKSIPPKSRLYVIP